MLKAGLISFALCAALFSAVSNCATFSKETQAKLRDVQADNFEDNSVAIALDDNKEEREGIDEDEDEIDTKEEDSEDEDEDEPESEIAEIKDDTTELEENDFLESDEPERRRRRRSRRRGRRGRNRPRRRRRRGRWEGGRPRRRRSRPRRGRRIGGRRRGGWRRGGSSRGRIRRLVRCGQAFYDPRTEKCCTNGGRFVVVLRGSPCPI